MVRFTHLWLDSVLHKGLMVRWDGPQTWRRLLCVRCWWDVDRTTLPCVPTPTRWLPLNSRHAHNLMGVLFKNVFNFVQSLNSPSKLRSRDICCCSLLNDPRRERSRSRDYISSSTSLKGAASSGWLTCGRAPWTMEWLWHAQLGRCVSWTQLL